MLLLEAIMPVREWIELGSIPVASAITWLVSTRRRRNDTLAEIQKTVDLLVKKNHELVQQLTEANCKIAEQSDRITELTKEVGELKAENEGCKALLSKLSGGQIQ